MQLSVTPTAVAEVRKFLTEQGVADGAGLRIRVVPGGCSGFQYSLNIEEATAPDDEVFETSDIRMFVDPLSKRYLEGVELDFVSSAMGSGFTFRNPNATGGCGCGSSFTV